jgi:GNAT superfamily N-acetyltransferase
VHGTDEETRARLGTFARRLGNVPRPLGVVRLGARDAPDAVGLGILADEWVGVYGMATRPSARRRGAGRAVVHALAAWARDSDAPRMYLQVEESNQAGRALYEGAGFRFAYSYWYRTLATTT